MILMAASAEQRERVAESVRDFEAKRAAEDTIIARRGRDAWLGGWALLLLTPILAAVLEWLDVAAAAIYALCGFSLVGAVSALLYGWGQKRHAGQSPGWNAFALAMIGVGLLAVWIATMVVSERGPLGLIAMAFESRSHHGRNRGFFFVAFAPLCAGVLFTFAWKMARTRR